MSFRYEKINLSNGHYRNLFVLFFSYKVDDILPSVGDASGYGRSTQNGRPVKIFNVSASTKLKKKQETTNFLIPTDDRPDRDACLCPRGRVLRLSVRLGYETRRPISLSVCGCHPKQTTSAQDVVQRYHKRPKTFDSFPLISTSTRQDDQYLPKPVHKVI